MISVPGQYALRLLVHVTQRQIDGPVRVRDAADAENIPYPYLAKIVGQLVQRGYLDSFKGPRGGIRLARAPHHISVYDVLKVVDGREPLEGCVLGLPVCGDEDPCPVHAQWKPVKQALSKRLLQATLADLAQAMERKNRKRS